MEFKDYYKILGVDADADDKSIKAAYRKLARKYHPDVSSEEDAEHKFKEVSEAYEVLRDKEKRAEYDVARQYGGARGFEPPPGWQGGAAGSGFQGDFEGGFSDFFEEVFGQAGHGSRQGYSRQHFTRRGEDIELALAIFLEDAFKGESRTISYEVPSFDERGRLTREARTLKVKIPAGVTEGERIRLKGQGAPGIGDAPAGDLYLHIRFAPHPLYLVEGSDLTITVPVAPWEAALGCKLTVPTLEGDISLTVPANSQNGKRMRVRGKGLGRADKRGDLYVVLRVTMPESASQQEQTLWQQLAAAANFDPRRNWGVNAMSETVYYLSLSEITHCAHVSEETVVTIVEQGIVQPRGAHPAEWQFEPPMVATLQRACRLQRDLELDWAAVALALDLLDELEQLRQDNERLRRQLGALMELE